MKATTIHDLELALNVSEQSDQTIIDLQIDRALLRVLLSDTLANQSARELLASSLRNSSRCFQLTDLPPLEGWDSAKTMQHEFTGDSHHRLTQIILEGRNKNNS